MGEQELVVGVVRERGPGERRVALSPDGVGRLRALGVRVVVEKGAGEQALFPDAAYREAGADVVTPAALRKQASITLYVGKPALKDLTGLAPGHVVIGLLDPLNHVELVRALAESKLTALSLDHLPRTLSRAQAMDVLSSQANVAGYQAVLVAASAYDGFFPMLTTAAGTTRPAAVLVLGAGVAGLQALSTARRLGAVVTGSDVREAARGDVLSTGAAFLDLGAVGAGGAGGYARDLTEEERAAQQQAVAEAIGRFDVVITTAQVPGRRPPLLVDGAALAALKPGSVVVDLAASSHGGNVAGSVPDASTTTTNGVTVIGAGALPSRAARASSTAFSRNVCALLATLLPEGRLELDLSDAVLAGVLITHEGEVVHPHVLERLAAEPKKRARR
ncbi:MAG TPA: NAD(P) transhydrogenase subunit alpha [Mycobacteriales bacterium]|nr:NAD(P) transhydrogenase subunit alpha [Mycobacteriales bacterium]